MKECYDCKQMKVQADTLHLKGVKYPLCKECSTKRVEASRLKRKYRYKQVW